MRFCDIEEHAFQKYVLNLTLLSVLECMGFLPIQRNLFASRGYKLLWIPKRLE